MHNAQVRAATLWGLVKKRSQQPTLKPFGEYLEGLRGKVSRERISLKLAALGVPLGGSTLAQYEKGAVWAPDACVLWGLSTIYRVPIEDLVNRLRENRLITLNYDAVLDEIATKVNQDLHGPALADTELPITETAQLVSEAPPDHGQTRIVSTDLETVIREMRDATAALRLALVYNADVTGKKVAKSARQAAKARAAVARKRANPGKNRRKGSGAA